MNHVEIFCVNYGLDCLPARIQRNLRCPCFLHASLTSHEESLMIVRALGMGSNLGMDSNLSMDSDLNMDSKVVTKVP